MTVSAGELNVVERNGDGSATSFAFSFTIYESTDLVVTKVASDGTETVLTEGTGATNYAVVVSSYPGSGSVTYPAILGTELAVGESIVIQRVLPLEQETELSNQGGYYPKTLETQLDKIVRIEVQQQEEIARSLKGPVTDTVSVEMPSQTDRASKFLAFSASGVPIASAGSAGGVAVSTFMETVLDDTTAAAARTTLGAAATSDLPSAASTTEAGIVELANELETSVGTDTTRAVTPNSLKGKLPWGATPGTADAIAVTYSPALTGLPDGQLCFFRAAAANTSTTPTFNPNGLGALTIVKNGNQPLAAGDIAGQWHEIILRYEATNTRWELLNPAVPAATVAGRVKLVDNDWSTGTPSSVTFEDADGMDWSTYSYFEIELQGYISATCRLLCTFSQGGAYETGGTDYFYANTGFRFSAGSSNATSAINIPNIYNEIYKGGAQYNEMFHMRATLYPGLSDGTNICGPYIHWSFVSSAGPGGNRGHANGTGSLRNLVATEIDGIKFEQNTGNMPNGSFKVWGII